MINTKTAIAVAKAFALMLVASSAHAQLTNLVTNGGFEQTTGPNNGTGQFYSLNITGWHGSSGSGINSGANYMSVAANNQVVLSYSWPGVNTLQLWTTQNGGPNVIPSSPDGGKFVVADGDWGLVPITQTINGLTPGAKYNLTFDYAAALMRFPCCSPEYGNNVNVTPSGSWKVSLGNQQFEPTSLSGVVARGFSGWSQASFTYTATASSEVLSFLADGTPLGVPSAVLLDGVSLAPVPEPEEWAMMLVGAGLVSWQVRRKQAKVTA